MPPTRTPSPTKGRRQTNQSPAATKQSSTTARPAPITELDTPIKIIGGLQPPPSAASILSRYPVRMARRSPGGQARIEQATPPAIPIPLPIAPPSGRLVFLPPDWLPKALIAGDIVIAAVSVLLAYWFHHSFDPIHTLTPGELPLAPYVVAIPFVVVIYVIALTANHQYQSWRGRTLVDLLLQLYSGIGLAAILILALISLGNLGAQYSRLTITYAIVLSAV